MRRRPTSIAVLFAMWGRWSLKPSLVHDRNMMGRSTFGKKKNWVPPCLILGLLSNFCGPQFYYLLNKDLEHDNYCPTHISGTIEI